MSAVQNLINALLWDIYGKTSSRETRFNINNVPNHANISRSSWKYSIEILQRLSIEPLAEICASLRIEIRIIGFYLEKALISRDNLKCKTDLLNKVIENYLRHFAESQAFNHLSLIRKIFTKGFGSRKYFNEGSKALKLLESDHNESEKIKVKSLTAISINVNSIIRNTRRINLLKLLNTYKPDIVFLSETKINKKHEIEFKNYNIIRRDRPDSIRGGGTAILLKQQYSYTVIKSLKVENFKCLESTIIELSLVEGKKIILGSLYAPKDKKGRRDFNEELQLLFSELKLYCKSVLYVMTGDINAKHKQWKNSVNNSRGIFLKQWIEKRQVEYKLQLYSSDTPTYPEGKSYLDICLADVRLKFKLNRDKKLKTVPYDSDHHGLCMKISLKNKETFKIIKKKVTNTSNEMKEALLPSALNHLN